jgi:O-antigen/teichoic acid export membrane protein
MQLKVKGMTTASRRREPEAEIPDYGEEGPSVSIAASKPRSGLSLRANFSWTFVGNAVDAAAWWAMTVVLAKLGSPEHVGQFALGLAATAPVFMFATLRLRDIQATDAKQEYLFGDYFALRLVTTTLALLVVAGIALASGYAWETALVILATGVSKASEAISDVSYGLFMQYERLDRIAKSMMIKAPLSLLGLAIGYYLTGRVFWGVVGLATARIVIMVSYDIRNAALTVKPSLGSVARVTLRDVPRPRWSARTLTRLAWIALPLGLVTMLISLNSNIPRYFIESKLGSYQLGIFVAIAAFQKVAPTVLQALGRSASPRLAKYYAANNAKAFRKLALRLAGIGILLGAAGVGVALVGGRQLLTLFYGPEYALPNIFALVMLAAGIDYVATLLLSVVTSARYFRVQLPLQLLTTGTVALACLWLVPSIGLQGAAMALIAGNLVRALGTFGAAWHAHRALRKGPTTSEAQALGAHQT